MSAVSQPDSFQFRSKEEHSSASASARSSISGSVFELAMIWRTILSSTCKEFEKPFFSYFM
jgi:hypothetical protein